MNYKLIFGILSVLILMQAVSAEIQDLPGGQCKIVSVTGNQEHGVQVNCPSGFTATGGGWADNAKNDDDQDASYPLNNGWYCQEDDSSSDSKCYAVCCNSNIMQIEKIEKVGSQNNGIRATYNSGFILGGGFWDKSGNGDDQDDNMPLNNSWLCTDDESSSDSVCFGLFGTAKQGFNLDFKTISVIGNQEHGVQANCPSGYSVIGGGFGGEYSNDDDQDYSYPINNGWFCKEDQSVSSAGCYARCMKADYAECHIDSDCGTNGYIGDNFCHSNNVYRNYRTFTCNNGLCSNSTLPVFMTNCSYGCTNGSCNNQCSINSNCGTQTSYLTCSGNNLINVTTTPTCSAGSCSNVTSNNTVQICAYGCSNNSCLPQPANLTAALNAPANNAILNYSSVNFIFTISGNAAPSSAKLVIDNSIVKMINIVLGSNTINYNLSSGNHTWKIIANDSNNNNYNSETRNIIINLSSQCLPNWNCTSWSLCTNGWQTRTCTDLNSCNNNIGKPAESASCSCTPDWDCSSWSSCSNGWRTRNCHDNNNCNSNSGKPS
jgi:hypothetical protein